MNATELRTKTVSELQALLIETTGALLVQKRSLAAGELPNPRVVNTAKKDIARIHTCLTEKALETSKGDA